MCLPGAFRGEPSDWFWSGLSCLGKSCETRESDG
jgi:hypothetical protein